MRNRARWLWLLLLIPVIFGLLRLRLNVEVLDLLPSDIPAVTGLKLYQEHFANARELIVTLETEEAETAENAAHTLAERLRERKNLVASVTWEPPWLEEPGLSGELIGYLWFNQPPELLAELTNRLSPEKLGLTLAETREHLASSMSPEEIARGSYDPYGLTRLPESTAAAGAGFGQGQELFSANGGKLRILFLQANHDLTSYKDCAAWLEQVREVIKEVLKSMPGGEGKFTVGYTGRPAFVAEISEGMQHDMTYSVGGTAVIIAILFWLAHRRIKPMLWLLTLLALILGSTLALGGLIYGAISVVSMGFAAILLGLAVDYAVVHYQEALAHPNLTIPEIRSAIAPSIFWAAVTTISAFLVLNFGGLPGLGQLGTLVGLGVALSACIMIFEFLPPLFPERRARAVGASGATARKEMAETEAAPAGERRQAPARAKLVWMVTGVILASTLAVMVLKGPPRIDPTANALRPRNSTSFATMEKVQSTLEEKREPLWVIISGKTEREVASKLQAVETVLARAASNQLIGSFRLPTPLWPRPNEQAANRKAIAELAGRKEEFKQTALTNGFAASALGLTSIICDTWERAANTPGVFWPTNRMSEWLLQKAIARTGTNFFVIGLISPGATQQKIEAASLAKIETEMPRDGVWISGWELLGQSIFSRVKANMWKVAGPMVFLVMLSLWLAFRRWQEITLSLAVLVLSGLTLMGLMHVVHWSWNLLNLMALPLILGTGVDYSIFMQLALRRYHGDLTLAYRAVGRALLLCGGTAIAGFGSLGLSSNAGMASLGQVCAVGIAANMLISVFLLPIWWYGLRAVTEALPGNALRGGE